MQVLVDGVPLEDGFESQEKEFVELNPKAP